MVSNIVYASFWLRLLAAIIDTIWLYGIIYIALWYVSDSNFISSETISSLTHVLIKWLIPLLVTTIFWRIKSATPGKMLLQIKIVDADTLQPSSRQKLLIRYLAYAISAAPLCLGFFWVIWDKRKQGWHDKIANTIVIREKESGE